MLYTMANVECEHADTLHPARGRANALRARVRKQSLLSASPRTHPERQHVEAPWAQACKRTPHASTQTQHECEQTDTS